MSSARRPETWDLCWLKHRNLEAFVSLFHWLLSSSTDAWADIRSKYSSSQEAVEPGFEPSCPMGKAKDVTIIFLPLFVSARKHVGLASKSKWSDKTKVGAVSPPLSERASTTPFPFDVAEERGIQSKYLPLFAGLQRENSWFSPFLSFRLFDRLSLHV